MNSAIHRDFPDLFTPAHLDYFSPGFLTRLSPRLYNVVTESVLDQPPG